MERANTLLRDHWDYIQALLSIHDCDEDDIKMIEFHYKTAFIHGYKHGVEDSKPKG